MTKLPKEIKVLGRTFEVKYPKKVDKEDSYGETNGPERVIKIRSTLSTSVTEDTLLHETIHAILYTAGISELLDEDKEEAIVVALENGLIQLYERKDLTRDK